MKIDKRSLVLNIIVEIIWWCIGIVIAAFIMFPLYNKMHYNFLLINGVIILLAVLYFRYILFFRQILWLRSLWFRFLLFAININLFVYLLRKEQFFMTVYDTFLISDLGVPFKPFSLSEMEKVYNYFFKEVNIALSACLVLIIVFNIRLILSYWKMAKTRLEDNT